MMKYLLRYALGLVALAACGIASANEFSANVALSSDYRFRGISQTNDAPAISGGFDYGLESGVYIGTWASNVASWSDGTTEIDYYGGYAFDITDGVGGDVGILYYQYPSDGQDPDLDYVEVYASIAFSGATVGVNYSPDYFAETDSFWYLYGGYDFPVSDTLSVGVHVGYNAFADEEAFDSFIGADSGEDGYLDYSVSLNAALPLVDFSLAVIGTDIDDEICKDNCEASLVATISKSM